MTVEHSISFSFSFSLRSFTSSSVVVSFLFVAEYISSLLEISSLRACNSLAYFTSQESKVFLIALTCSYLSNSFLLITSSNPFLSIFTCSSAFFTWAFKLFTTVICFLARFSKLSTSLSNISSFCLISALSSFINVCAFSNSASHLPKSVSKLLFTSLTSILSFEFVALSFLTSDCSERFSS